MAFTISVKNDNQPIQKIFSLIKAEDFLFKERICYFDKGSRTKNVLP
jgi:hypothetical protein